MTDTGDSPGPLSGLRVIELAGIGPGPFAATLLADLGAEVLRIDRPGSGGLDDIPHEVDALRRGRRSAIVDLRHPAAAQVVLQLVRGADVLIESNRPGVAERLGVGPDACLEVNPRLVYGRMTGWGQHGPLSHTAGHDITYLARTGALHAMGRRGEPPAVPLNLVGDFGGGSLYLVFGVLAAVIEATRSGRGQVVDAAIVDGTASLTSFLHSMLAVGMWTDTRGVNLLDTGAPWYDVYETADGKHMAVGAMEPKFFAQLMAGLGLAPDEERRRDRTEWPALRSDIATAFLRHTRDEWASKFAGTDACVEPVLSLLEAQEDPHLVARQTFIDVGGVRQPAPAPRFSRTPPAAPVAPAAAGSHTRSALAEWGLENVDELLAMGVVVQS